MRILLFSSVVPFPLDEGGKTSQFVFLAGLVNQYNVTLVCEVGNEEDMENLQDLAKQLKGLKVISLRAEKKIKKKSLLQRVIGGVTWRLNKILNNKQPHPVLENPNFINPGKTRRPEVIEQWKEILQQEKPDLVQIDFIDNADVVFLVPEETKKVLVLHDLRSSSVEQAAKNEGFPAFYTQYVTELARAKEWGMLKNFDAIITFSEQDQKRVQQKGFANACTIPFAVNIPPHTFQDDYTVQKLAMVGPGEHYPNKDALDWYCSGILETTIKEFGLQTLVIGKWSEVLKKNYQPYTSVIFTGFIEDLQKALNGSILIVPLRIGSGIRTKILEAFANGIPVITTTIGAEGLPVTHREHCLIADDPKSFVAGIKELINDKNLVRKLRSNAYRLVSENYSKDVVISARIKLYQDLVK